MWKSRVDFWFGPWFAKNVALGAPSGGRRARLEVAWATLPFLEVLRQQLRADHLAAARELRPVRVAREDDLGHAGDEQRIGDAEHQREEDDRDQGCGESASSSSEELRGQALDRGAEEDRREVRERADEHDHEDE